ncbi:protein suppressor of hairy wing [Bradysia coprophila]|uniref:protein suppressor of hairy wing n=1 Tax=Bradysia coprophila TaxID=38358 RepID=UPI00187D8868|nr:protein suppressor of hairy wing [Bradysia coprophila]XP_037051691.1 protein suppressor of hairy wing [Bradysia coprophila]
MDESMMTVNMKINDHTNEIEYIKMENIDSSSSDEGETEEGEQIDDENVLVAKSDGVMTIKSKKKTVLEHICAKCNKTYKTLVGLKRHLNLCRNMPKDQIIQLKQEAALEDIDFAAVDENTCFCCMEPKDTAHVGHVKCNFCPKSFKSHLNLERHLFTIHSASTEFPCECCNATCPSKLVLELHMESHSTGKPFSCQVCGRDFTRKYHLDRHKMYSKCGSGKNKSELTCQVCSRVFTRIDNLREHLRGHMGKPTRRKDYQCPYCEKSFYGSSLLNIHIRTHTGEKPFLCDLCEKSFPSNGALRKHRRMHTGERPYSCSMCPKTFAAKETLNRHTKIHTGVRPHVCNVCGKEFIQSTQLRAHMFHHSGENGFNCTQCQAKFNRKSRLDKHVKQVHSEAAPEHSAFKLQCDQCDETFASMAKLNSHKKTHLEIKICTKCNKTCFGKEDLVRHIRLKHKDVYDATIKAEAKKIQRKVASNELITPDLIHANKKGNVDDTHHVVVEDVEMESSEYHITYQDGSNLEATIVLKQEKDQDQMIHFSDGELTEKVKQLLNLLVDDDTLAELGWPEKSVEDVLSSVIEQCDQTPADYTTCPDYATKIRENTKLLFTTVIDTDAIKELLNNQTIDEVILHVLKTAG